MTNPLEIQFCYVRPDTDGDIPLPRYMTPQAAGMDICAAIETPVLLNPQEILLIPTGFSMALPAGYEAQIRPRSGLAINHGVTLINAPGTIDADYRGEVKIALINLGRNNYTVNRGDRIAQMVIQKVEQLPCQVVPRLDATERDAGGFGHTGY